jgi:hypothetical protein
MKLQTTYTTTLTGQMPSPLPTQLSGAKFLADRRHALLADLPRVGKTGAAVIAADYLLADRILVVTTASGRGVWRSGFREWSSFGRPVQVLSSGRETIAPASRVVVVGWAGITQTELRTQLLRERWDVLIGDEAHYAKSFEAKRTQSFYGVPHRGGAHLAMSAALASKADVVWALTGTPIPNAPNDLYPMLRALWPERLAADEARGWPNVTTSDAFLERYCVTKPKKISQWHWIKVVISGRNLPELAARMGGLFLQRTQADVGITEPEYELFPLYVSDAMRREAEADVDRKVVLAAAQAGDTKALEMHLGSLRRVTGSIVARAVIDAAKEELSGELDKVVLAYWHREVGQALAEGLRQFGVVGIDGDTPAVAREAAAKQFRDDPKTRVFLGQIQAAGEAIDLSAAATLWFVESSFTPKDMLQMSLRITNHGQKRRPLVRVCVLEGSIYEALQAALLRKWSAIKEVIAA